MGGTCSVHERDEKCTQYFGWKSEGKTPLERLWRRMEEIIIEWFLGNMVGMCGLDASGSEWDQWRAVVSTVKNIQVPQRAGNFLTSLAS
jgi:hypothetical protein